ncbi:phage minor head protein [Erythrobacter sp. LQ02-29]|uniref:phage head morphogenesis protein n=1 Tax=Erythrobacter sp. LQ02-29 TaxID=2920384 RepID=UPI001F4DA731|nr:phage minor head protein [Erythrobacter sp. LQ02-29]MCP9222760.1 phage minor head protein [Erythrobacter sp. LQ02-29]
MPSPDLRLTMFLPPDDTVRVWQLREELRPSVRWHEMMHEDHATAFTVAKIARLDLLRSIRASLDTVIRNGGTFESWKANLLPELKKSGWWGSVADPDLTGTTETIIVNERRLQTIFNTNLRMSEAAGAWAKIQREKDRFPYLRYLSHHWRRHPRQDHLSWHGLILPVDHPWWQAHVPPNGWGCKCHFEQVSEARMQRKGWKVSTPPEDGPATRFHASGRREPIMVPAGIHPGFGYNPGTAHLRAIADKALNSIRMAEQAGLEKQAQTLLADILEDPAFEQFIALPDQVFPFAWLNANRRAIIGAQSGIVRLSRATMEKQAMRGRFDLQAQQYRLAARIIDTPQVVFRERGNHLVMFGQDNDGNLYEVVLKTTADGTENYLSSVHRSSPRRIRAKSQSGLADLIFDRRLS